MSSDPADQFASSYIGMGNNPVMGVDPDGRFVHLLIGAAIGGAINVLTNLRNIKNFGQGLAYFGIGAAAGALGSGIGSGIGAVLSGGSFGAGFIGSQAVMSTISSMSGFVSGAAMGAGGGLAGGFVTGAGNAFMRGEDLGGALTSGFTSGLIGGVSGGVIGGALGGIKALIEHKSFWDGATVTRTSKVLADVGVLPKTIQDGPYDCASATLETVEKFRGGHRTQADFRALVSETNGVRPDKIIFAAGYETTPQYATPNAISKSLQSGKLGILSLTTDQAALNHAVVPSKIMVSQILRQYSWKNSVSKIFYEIFGMNPATNTMFMEKLFRGTPEMLFKLQYFPLN